MILVFLVPLVLALSLCLLSPGRQASIGIGATAVFLLVLWIAFGTNQEAGLVGSFAVLAAPGVALAGLAHLTHRIVGPHLPVWGYAVAAVVLLYLASAFLRAIAGT
jgi:hypothetical protein